MDQVALRGTLDDSLRRLAFSASAAPTERVQRCRRRLPAAATSPDCARRRQYAPSRSGPPTSYGRRVVACRHDAPTGARRGRDGACSTSRSLWQAPVHFDASCCCGGRRRFVMERIVDGERNLARELLQEATWHRWNAFSLGAAEAENAEPPQRVRQGYLAERLDPTARRSPGGGDRVSRSMFSITSARCACQATPAK